ncbi:flagellar hook protein FlgE [Thiomicrorhabdus sp.]|uniref:flagellar hook protein FlgE n=1 Tax=Thiomicrorhabdus sp. TaxID=2039724 RepID=UPI0035622830
MGVSFDLNALSGINAASTGLGVISNNLANAQSVGFKGSRAEFADMFSGAQNTAGNGARVAAITQDFGQGTINGTGRDLDMAIDGEGFFVLEDQTGRYGNIYTREGSFKLDKDGYLTDQEGNKVQGYQLNLALSTETNPVFDTTLSSIDLDELNKTPKATDEMNFDINLDGEEANNIDPVTGVSVGNDTAANLDKLVDIDTAAGPYDGFPDFSTNKIIHDSLGGEHRLTANFYKRDVVSVTNSDLTYVPATDSYTAVAAGTGDTKYTSWIVQYTMQDYNETTGQWETSGHRADQTAVPPTATTEEGQVFELRYDTSGNLIDVRMPVTAAGGTYDPTNIVGQDVLNSPLPDIVNGGASGWETVGTQPQLDFIIDTPLTGANDPLGNPNDASTIVNIDANLGDMTQFAGTYSLRGVSQNGYSVGDLVGLNTGLDGVIEARYSNGRSVPVAQLALANFSDKNALQKLGGQTYAESFDSGLAQLAKPETSGMGSINAGSLEYSNVDVASELVNMIQTQRTYQASAQVISTSQTLTQTILQL